MEQWDLPKWYFPMMKTLRATSDIGVLVVEWLLPSILTWYRENIMRKIKLEKLRNVCKELEAAERKVDELRGVKWNLVHNLKDDGHDFTATTEGMDIVLSSSPSFNWS